MYVPLDIEDHPLCSVYCTSEPAIPNVALGADEGRLMADNGRRLHAEPARPIKQ